MLRSQRDRLTLESAGGLTETLDLALDDDALRRISDTENLPMEACDRCQDVVDRCMSQWTTRKADLGTVDHEVSHILGRRWFDILIAAPRNPLAHI